MLLCTLLLRAASQGYSGDEVAVTNGATSLLCQSWQSDPVACVRSYANVEWSQLLPWNRTNPSLGNLITYGQNAIPIGNGDFGALVSTDGVATLTVALNAASAYDESGQLFKPGVINITFSPVPSPPTPFRMSFDAGDGSVVVVIGSLMVMLWFDAVGDKLVVEHNSSDSALAYTAAAEVFVGRPNAQVVPGAIHWDCYTYQTSADHKVVTKAGVAFYHQNPATPALGEKNNYWWNQVLGMDMAEQTYTSVPNILSSRITGGLLRIVNANTITVTLKTRVGKSEAEWLQEVEASAMASDSRPSKSGEFVLHTACSCVLCQCMRVTTRVRL